MCCHTHWYLAMYAPIHLSPHAAGRDCSVLTGLCCRHGYEMGAEPVLGAGFIKWVKRKGHRLSTNVSCDTCYVNEHGICAVCIHHRFQAVHISRLAGQYRDRSCP